MYNKINQYMRNSGNLANLKDARAQKILQKANNFGIKIFENPVLVSELLNLEEKEVFDKEIFSEFVKIFDICEEAILRAQMSS